MSTENENWRDASTLGEESNTDRDGNQFRNNNFGRPSYSRENGSRPRPRFNPNTGERVQHAYSSDRSYRPRFSKDYGNGERPQRPAYGNDRPYRPRYNAEEGARPQQRTYDNDRPYRPRFNNENGDRPQRPYSSSSPYSPTRPARPRFHPNAEGGERPQRPYGNDRPQRPRFNPNSVRPNRDGNAPYGRPSRPRTADYNPNAKYSKKKQLEYKEQNYDPNEPIRLNKFLANAGVCSRREADEFITAGVVSVNGQVVTELGTKIKRGDEVKFHDQPVKIERKIYVLLNKPKDTVTTSDDPQARRTVMDLVKGACTERIYPVGRLDRNTTGVLLLTNDGDLASKLTHPKYLKKKIYHVRLDKNLTKADMDQIAAGIQLDDGEIHADAISYTDENKKDEVGIEIHSGKNRIVRRIFESLGYKVVKLDRVYFAGLTKKGLRRGDWRYLTEMEVNYLRMGSFE